MKFFKRLIISTTANRFIQALLEKNVVVSQYLMGIGAGAHVGDSGEGAVFKRLRQRGRPPYCVFDVGANQGQFLRLLQEELGSADMAVHCFEPGRATFGMLRESCQGDQRVILNNVGIGRERGTAVLHSDQAGSGLASLTRRRLDHFGIEFDAAEEVVITTIDQYCETHAIDRIDLLKLDIEGHEIDALAGARNMFAKGAINMVTFEFGGCNIDTRTFFQDFWYFFKEYNMSLLRLTPSGYLYPISTYQEDYEQFRTMNFVAVRL